MESKKPRGRQKIPMSKIENEVNRSVTFCKRRSTLYKKASELVKTCDVDIGIILFFPANKPFSFFHPTKEAVIDRFLNPNLQLNDSTHLVAAHVRQKVNALNNKSEEIACIEEATSAQAHKLDKMKENGQKRWWESIETFNADEVAKFESWLIFADFSMKYHLKRLENKASSS